MDDRARYRSFIDVLHANNVGNYIELPQIAVMGDTSAGKSSLLSAVCGIEFPSNDALTTRCPARVRLEKSDQEYMTVGIKWTGEGRNGEWQTKRFESSDMDGVKQAIADAQACILKNSACGERGCASDVVEIEVHGPDCVNLTLIDLPGIVRTTGDAESDSLGQDIRNLINSFLSNSRCIILAVLPANVDYHNSGILADAKKVDPEGLRTIPVITKADSIDKGGESSVLNLLLGKELSCKLGFHMTKCRGQKQLNDGVTLEASIELERKFFESEEPWRSQEDRSLFGIDKLKEKLAGLQVRMIEESMPGIMEQILSLKTKALADLEALGVEMTSVHMQRNVFNRAKEKLFYAMKEVYDGNESDLVLKERLSDAKGYNWCAQMQHEITKFGEIILSQQLNNITKELNVGMDVIVEFDDGSDDLIGKIVSFSKDRKSVMVAPRNLDEMRSFSETNKSENFVASNISLAWTVGQEVFTADGDLYRILKCFAKDEVSNTQEFTVNIYKNFSIASVRPNLEWLRDRMDRTQTNKLSCFLSADLCENIISEMIVVQIQPACLKFLDAIFKQLVVLIETAVESCFPESFPRLKVQSVYLLRDLADAVYSTKTADLMQCMERESAPFTQNHYLYDCIERKRNERLERKCVAATAALEETIKNATAETVGTIAVASSAALNEQIKAIFSQSMRLSMEDHKLNEMEVILDAYGKVASKRFIDEIPMIAKNMFKAFFRNCRESITTTDSELESLMHEGNDIALRRKQLKTKVEAKVEALQIAERAVRDLNMGIPAIKKGKA